jgi:hypothetical protein
MDWQDRILEFAPWLAAGGVVHVALFKPRTLVDTTSGLGIGMAVSFFGTDPALTYLEWKPDYKVVLAIGLMAFAQEIGTQAVQYLRAGGGIFTRLKKQE